MRLLYPALALGCLVLPALPARAADAGTDFFEQKIRPVLVEHCYACHSAEALKSKKLRGGLLLDTRAGLRKGGDSGAVLDLANPAKSLLLKAVHYTDPDLKMPPKGKLPATVIADLEKWLALGAPDPRVEGAALAGIDFAAARKHWAFQPLRKPTPPGGGHPIDAFIQARLAEKGLALSPPAEPRTLLRRLSFVLHGLPPSLDEVDHFHQSAIRNPQSAMAAAIERLLASPHYGERWARHWLDIARYADTKDGVLMYGADRIRPYAYTYRDYVIKAFNEDTPFDRFVQEQLAADLIEPKVEPWRLGALGFLTLGRLFDNNIHDVIDDRIDTTTRAFLGLTVACARCHDHKYDPIPTADYYALYGVFASCASPIELPRIGSAADAKGEEQYEKVAVTKRQALQKFLDEQHTLLSETARLRTGDYLLQIATQPADPLETAIFFLSLAPGDLRPQITNRWRRYLEQHATPSDPIFGPWHALLQLPEAELAQRLPALQAQWRQLSQLNPLVRDAFARAKIAARADVARTYGELFKSIYTASKETPPTDDAKQLLALLTSKDSPAYIPRSQTQKYMSRSETDSFGGKLQEIDRLAVKSPHAPPRAMVVLDSDLVEPHIFTRGNPALPGERVPRQFLRILTDEPRTPFAHGSGRLDLARAIADPRNPLTARVLVNRMWMHHFGEPLVAAPSDFGVRSAPPSHPELLDYLAARFIEDGWSLKKLHRLILTSATWQQSSLTKNGLASDPENRLLWRAHRRRLDLEAMRDTLLSVAGRLDRAQYGRPVDIVGDAKNARRTIYGLVDRQTLPNLFRAFDFASPDQSAERRPMTTVPQQALFGMNAPFMIEQVQAVAARVESTAKTPEERIATLYRLALLRAPQPRETALALEFLRAAEVPPPAGLRSQLTPLQQLAQVLLLTNEFLFVD